MEDRKNNFYLGYSIEDVCMKVRLFPFHSYCPRFHRPSCRSRRVSSLPRSPPSLLLIFPRHPEPLRPSIQTQTPSLPFRQTLLVLFQLSIRLVGQHPRIHRSSVQPHLAFGVRSRRDDGDTEGDHVARDELTARGVFEDCWRGSCAGGSGR